jgi:hypothetical protein
MIWLLLGAAFSYCMTMWAIFAKLCWLERHVREIEDDVYQLTKESPYGH